jgi:hypothetical protein
MMMNVRIAVLGLAFVVPACASSIQPREAKPVPAANRMVYDLTSRIIPFSDGSQLLLYRPDPPDGRPPAMQAFFVSKDGREHDQNLRLEQFILSEISPGSFGQIRGGAMSSDGQWLALVGGWASVHDHRGHNGIFVLQRRNGSWGVKSWFDLPGITIGDVAFGPDDTLALMTQPTRAEGGAAPILTIYSLSGQNLGSFLETPGHANAADTSTMTSRLQQIGESSYAVLDTATDSVRFLRLATSGRTVTATETKRVPVPFSTERMNIVAFDAHPDGRMVFARSFGDASHHAKTVVTIVKGDGKVAEEWTSPQYWRYGYLKDGALYGYGRSGQDQPMQTTTVAVDR